MQPFDQLVDPIRFAAARDPEGRAWIAELPILVEEMCRQWGLEHDLTEDPRRCRKIVGAVIFNEPPP